MDYPIVGHRINNLFSGMDLPLPQSFSPSPTSENQQHIVQETLENHEPSFSEPELSHSIAEADRIIDNQLMNLRDFPIQPFQVANKCASETQSKIESGSSTTTANDEQNEFNNVSERIIEPVGHKESEQVDQEDTESNELEKDELDKGEENELVGWTEDEEYERFEQEENELIEREENDQENGEFEPGSNELIGQKEADESFEQAETVDDSTILETDEKKDDDSGSPRKTHRLVISDDEDEEESEKVWSSRKNADSDDQRSSQIFVTTNDSTNLEKDDDDEAKSEVGELIADIFGDSDEEKRPDDDDEDQSDTVVDSELVVNNDEDEPRMIGMVAGERCRKPRDFEWDFDVMLRRKRDETRRHRHRRRRDGSIDLLSDADEQIRHLVNTMKTAAKDDRHANTDRKPALHKRRLLPFVRSQLRKADLAEALVDNGAMSAVGEWLAPLPDKSLPALEIRSQLLALLHQYEHLEQSVLRQSGLGKAVMLLYKHPRETKENKNLAAKLISEWARPIFQLDTDFRALSREERMRRDFEHMPLVKKRRLSADADRPPTVSNLNDDSVPTRPGDKGWIGRARVPRPSTKDYVVRPKTAVEGPFRTTTGRGKTSRYDRKMRQMKDKKNKSLHAVELSIEGRKLT